MFTKEQILARLNDRHEQFLASPFGKPGKAHQDAIRRTIDALDQSFSHYMVLSDDERAQVRGQWLGLAAKLGVSVTAQSYRAVRTHTSLPPQVLAFFGDDVSCLPHRPQATDDYSLGMSHSSWERAKDLRSVELNPPAHVHWLIFDCDHSDYERWRTAGLPEPSFITINPNSGNHHLVYRLSSPVCRSERGRYRPLAYLRVVKEALRLAVGGDLSYNGRLTQNPMHPAWLTVRSAKMPAYTLAELAKNVVIKAFRRGSNKNWQRASLESTHLVEVEVGGRNRALFDAVRHWAYNNAQSMDGLQDYAESCNGLFQHPLGHSEVIGIVRSIERYIGSRRYSRQSGFDFSEKQAARGRLGGRPQTTAVSQPWVVAQVSRSTWYRHKRAVSAQTHPGDLQHRKTQLVGRPATTMGTRPWIQQGVSRATWYRHRKAEGDSGDSGESR